MRICIAWIVSRFCASNRRQRLLLLRQMIDVLQEDIAPPLDLEVVPRLLAPHLVDRLVGEFDDVKFVERDLGGLNRQCERETFADQLPEVVCPHARRTQRVAELVHLFGHGTGGRPGERLMKRLGMLVSDDTILRHLKRQVARLRTKTTVRVAGIDDWSWRKGRTYGTIICRP